VALKANHQAMRLLCSFSVLAVGLLAGCASSSSRLIAPARPAINPAEVRIYRTPPRHYQEIAVLDATSAARLFHGTLQGENEALQRLKEEAARVGANGVLLTLVGDRSRGAIGVGVGGGSASYQRRNGAVVSGAASGAAPIVQNSAQGVAIYVSGQP
jgi:hypothetical protein